jgi:hypothetical protein
MSKTIENPPAALARNEELVVQELPDEVLVYDLRRHKAHCLNKTSAFIWNHCDGQTTADQIAKLMEKEWQTPVSEDAVWFALDKLGKAELLHERITLPPAQAGMSRRSAIRRLGIGALLVPVVMTIVSPTAMAGASVPAPCIPCTTIHGTCPSVCKGINGCCFKNDSCNTGVGNLLSTTVDCTTCFTVTGGKSWRAVGGAACA